MFIDKFIEEKAHDFYNENIEQFVRDVYNYNETFRKYLSKENYFEKYIDGEIRDNLTELEKNIELKKEQFPYINIEDETKYIKDDLFLKLKIMFAQGLVKEIMRINMELEDDELEKSIRVLKERKNRLAVELNRMLGL